MANIESFVLAFVYFFMSLFGNSPANTPNIPEDENPSVVFVEEYFNYAWGYQCRGSFCDTNGNVYKYDFCDREGISAEEKKRAFLDIIENEKPAARGAFDRAALYSAREEALKIDQNAGFSERHTACDAGQKTLYICTADFEMIKLRSVGDIEKLPKDKTAKRLCGVWDKNLKKIG